MTSDIAESNRRFIQTFIVIFVVATLLTAVFATEIVGIPAILLVIAVISYLITQDVAKNAKPMIFVESEELGEELKIRNYGTGAAFEIKVKIVPGDITAACDKLEPEGTYPVKLPNGLYVGQAALMWKDKTGKEQKKNFKFDCRNPTKDPIKPVFPLFSWKK